MGRFMVIQKRGFAISRVSEERLMQLLARLEITETQFKEMLDVLQIDREYVVSILENKQAFADFQFMMDYMSFLGTLGISPEDDKICLVKNIILNLEKELMSVRDYNVNPDEVKVDVCSDDNFFDQLVEWERLNERAKEIEERRAAGNSKARK
jgi:hypothetical protein